jgi:hypothetical protein
MKLLFTLNLAPQYRRLVRRLKIPAVAATAVRRTGPAYSRMPVAQLRLACFGDGCK